MKKSIFLFLLLLFGLKAFAQYPMPSGTSPAKTMLGFFKIAGSDTTFVIKDANGNIYPVSRDLIAKSTDFEGFGTLTSKFGIRDTLLKSNWVIRSASTTLPALTLISPNLTDYVFKIKDTAGNSRVGASFSTIFAQEYHYWKGQQYAALNMSDSGSTVFRNLPNGHLMEWASASKKWATLDSNGFILRTDTAFMTAHGDAVITRKWFDAHNTGGGGGTYTASGGIGLSGSDFRLATGATIGNIQWDVATNNLVMNADNGGGQVASTLLGNGIYQAKINQSGLDQAVLDINGLTGNSLLKLSYSTSGQAKSITLTNGGDVSGIGIIDNLEHLGLNGNVVFPISVGTQYAQYTKVDSLINAKIDSAGGSTGVTSVSAGIGMSFTTITSTGAVKADTTVLQTVLNFFPKADTRYYTKTASDARYEVPLTFTSGVSRSSNTVKADTSILRTVANSYSLAGMQTKLNNYALLASPTFTGTPAAPTATGGTNTTQIATTAFVQSAISGVSVPTAANPSGLLTFTAANGSNTTYLRNDGLHAIDSTVVRSVANSYSLSAMQTKLNNYTLQTRSISTGLGLSGGGNLTADRTIIADTTVLKSKAGFLTDYNNLKSADALRVLYTDTSAMLGNVVHINKNETILGQKTFNTAIIQSLSSIGTTSTDALIIKNPTAATSGTTVQNSGRLDFISHAWNTTATAADNTIQWKLESRNTSAATPTSDVYLSYSLSTNSTPSFTDLFRFSSNGRVGFGMGSNTLAQPFNNVGAIAAYNSSGSGKRWDWIPGASLTYWGDGSVGATMSMTSSGLAIAGTASSGLPTSDRLQTQGKGNTSATVNVDFQNNSGTSLWKLTDDGIVAMGTAPTTSAGTYDILTRNTSTGVVEKVLSSSFVSKPHTIFTPTTGGTVSLTNNQYNIINPAGTLVALTVNLPSSPANNDCVFIKYTQSITTVTYGNGTVVDGITAPTAGGLVVLTYDSGTTSWY